MTVKKSKSKAESRKDVSQASHQHQLGLCRHSFPWELYFSSSARLCLFACIHTNLHNRWYWQTLTLFLSEYLEEYAYGRFFCLFVWRMISGFPLRTLRDGWIWFSRSSRWKCLEWFIRWKITVTHTHTHFMVPASLLMVEIGVSSRSWCVVNLAWGQCARSPVLVLLLYSNQGTAMIAVYSRISSNFKTSTSDHMRKRFFWSS